MTTQAIVSPTPSPKALDMAPPSRRAGRLVAGLLSVTLVLGVSTKASAQAMVRNPTQPILVYQNQGHAGPVRAIVFDPVSGHLLTGGYDKVVHVWEVGEDRLNLIRTIRPPIWRGSNGAIFSIALSPARDAKGEGFLAVAGHGVQSSFGNVNLFSFPGQANLESGDLIGQIDGWDPKKQRFGHLKPVKVVLFHPQGLFLASAGFDGEIQLWNPATRQLISPKPAQKNKPPEELITSLAFDKGGNRLWSASMDGVVRLWDVSNPALPREVRNSGGLLQQGIPLNHPLDRSINAMGLSVDEKWLFLGTEQGQLIRIDAATLQSAQTLPGSGKRGAVEALAVSPDGTQFAVSVIRNVYQSEGNQTPPRNDSDIELRRVPDGALISTVHQTRSRVHCLAFSPKGDALAFAGDDSQSVFVKPLNTQLLLEAKGQGSTVWDVGFLKDGLTLGIARRPEADNGPPLIQGFDLKTREPQLVARADLLGSLRSDAGWTLTAVDELNLRVTGANQVIPIPLRKSSIRWWDFTIIPDATRPATEPPVVVVGCEAETFVYAPIPADPNNPQRSYRITRVLNGHSAAVLGVAPSRDGKWLATCSEDQTVRLWLVDRWNSIPSLGVKATPRDGKMFVDSVEPLGFGDAMGLKPGDLLSSVKVVGTEHKDFNGETPLLVNEGLWNHLNTANALTIIFELVRDGKTRSATTTKRDSPTASLFLSEDMEWVLWTPESYYDTSIKGDRTFLGFHRNGANADEELDLSLDCHFFTIDLFEKQLRKPKLFDALIATADKARALASIPREDTTDLVVKKQPPVVKLLLPDHPVLPENKPLVVQATDLRVNVQVSTLGFSAPIPGVKQIRVLVDTGVAASADFPAPIAPIPAGASSDNQYTIKLKPGLQQITAIAESSEGVPQPARLLVDYQPKVPPTLGRPPELYILALGTGEFAKNDRLSAIAKANDDLADVTKHFSDKDSHKYPVVHAQKPIVGQVGTLAQLRASLDALDSEATAKDFGFGDTVIVAVETHLIAVDDSLSVLAPFDADLDRPRETCLPTDEVTERLSKLAKKGCHVLLLLDVNHAVRSPLSRTVSTSKGLKEWARHLHKADVMTGIASIGGPSLSDSDDKSRDGLFVTAIIGSTDRRKWKHKSSEGDVMTLADFQDSVQDFVMSTSRSRQIAKLYPANVPLAIPFLIPPTSAANVALAPMK